MKKIVWTKKRIILLIISIITILAIAGSITAFLLLNSSDSPSKSSKKNIKRVVVVQNDDTDSENQSNDDDPSTGPTYKTTDSDDNMILIKIIKRVKRIFGVEEKDESEMYSNLNDPVNTLYVSDFGAKGDGYTDDGNAIFDAVMELCNCGPGSKLVFDNNKIYYVKNEKLSSVLYLHGVAGLEIDGCNSTIMLDNRKEFLSITNTKDCIVKNMHFDFKTKPAFSASCISIDSASGSALMKADRDIGMNDNEIYTPAVSWFGVLNKQDSRYHMFIEKYQMVSCSEHTFRIYFTEDTNTRHWLSSGDLQSNGMICPMPGIGHMQERGFSIVSNRDLSLESLKIHACSKFGMYIGENEGTLTINDVDFIPAENELDCNMNFTSWRDAFHTKDNRCSINWINCDATGNYDDIFNISSSTMYLSDYNIAKNRLTLVWSEAHNGVYYTIKPGDTLNIIDTDTGEDCGIGTVKRVVKQTNGKNIVVLDRPMTALSSTGKGVFAFFTNRCAPNSTITDCNFNGTFRFRGPITISNTYFYNQRTWIDLCENTEGPVPENITFRNCNIESGSGANFIIGANSGNTDENGYHIKNILFEGCKLESNALSIYPSDKQYVILRDCTERDGSKITDRN